MKREAEADLEEARPALQAALAALNSITPTDITALKTLKNPPNIVKRIFDCVLLLRHVCCLCVCACVWRGGRGVGVGRGPRTGTRWVVSWSMLGSCRTATFLPGSPIIHAALSVTHARFRGSAPLPSFPHPHARRLSRNFPINRVEWMELKGDMVITGSYDEAVKMMGDLNFLQALINFPKEAMTDETVELLQVRARVCVTDKIRGPRLSGRSLGCGVSIGIRWATVVPSRCTRASRTPWSCPASSPAPAAHMQPYFSAPDFNFTSAKKASGNVAGLCNWAEAMCKYHAVAKARAWCWRRCHSERHARTRTRDRRCRSRMGPLQRALPPALTGRGAKDCCSA